MKTSIYVDAHVSYMSYCFFNLNRDRHAMSNDSLDIKNYIRQIPDFPKPGISFYDISTLLANGVAWRTAINRLAGVLRPLKPQLLAGIESRGFLVAAPLALELGIGLIMVRKKGKLPGQTVSHEYALEYGSDVVEIQIDALKSGERIVVLDDLLATGGTLSAAIDLLRKRDAEVLGAASVIELAFLGGRERLDVPFYSIVTY